MRPGEIYLARFPFGDVPGIKLRPVLLLTGSLGLVPEVLVACRATSTCWSSLRRCHFLIEATPIWAGW
jgi:hypothetical protein